MIRAEPGLPIVMAAYDNLVIDEFYNNERRIVPAILSKKLSTGIWDGIEVFGEYCHGRISADSLSVVVRTDILRDNNRYSKDYTCAGDKATWMPALLEGRAGLINERCATYLIHDSSISTTIAADDRLNEFNRAMKELSAIAARRFSDRRYAGSGQEAYASISGLSGHGHACSLSPRGCQPERCFREIMELARSIGGNVR